MDGNRSSPRVLMCALVSAGATHAYDIARREGTEHGDGAWDGDGDADGGWR